jgi:dTDP-4-dehydrorhamnose reductase
MNQILLFGGSGILGSEVLRYLNAESYEYVAPTSTDLDIRDKEQLFKFISELKPSWIINCAAWTNVDGAESSFREAWELNSIAVKNLGTAAGLVGCKVIHISTDYVFYGESSNPYDESSPVNPVNKYGESKLEGENALLDVAPEAYVIRTSWLYGTSGKNFVKTIAGKAIKNEEARVVNDQIGSPTSARDLAGAIMSIVSNQPEPGIYNYSNEGSCSWFEFAQRIYERVGANPSLVSPISSDSLNLIARRPRYSLLSKEKWKSSGLAEVPRWEDSLDLLLPEIVAKLR